MPSLLVNFFIQTDCKDLSGQFDLGSVKHQLAGTKVNMSKIEEVQTVKIEDKTQFSFFWLKYGLDNVGDIIDPPTTQTLRKTIVYGGKTGCKTCGSTKKSDSDCEITITWKILEYNQN
jgi:hypothetical protein